MNKIDLSCLHNILIIIYNQRCFIFFTDLDNTIIIIKEVPAKVCSQCGEKYFEDEISKNIEKIVEQLKEISTEITIVNYKDGVA